ncbi:MAG: YitT family protein [Gammaproteobacteria bacterium]|jgi:uncharacterized membrane-anchored protein YitT (DUF2179 family)|nr:YitT family protein [Gammaproteobacteria bacterium]MBT7552900.1 YitT family protein [bacterium]MBT3725990.1 YitT family protein [Gammaproteobacteria bacterium]MBT4195262.1 YitT family protein [Gammaproteobacteria bacterium]MBT4448606.1 YitT family protein [Gammaproteobacteria bacterium]
MNIKSEIKNYLFVVSGSAILALGVVFFFISNNITTGGGPGLAVLLHHLTGINVGILMVAVNAPLLIIGIKYLGKMFAVRSIVAIVLSSAFIDFLLITLKVGGLTDDILLASVFGGAIIGLGVGLIMRGNASAGGTSIVAKVVAANSHWKPAQVILFIDFLIILSSIYVFADIEKAMWSMISIYFTAKAINTLLSGSPSKKVVHLVSDKAEVLSEKIIEKIIEKLGDSGSIIKGTGLHPKEEKSIIFIIVELNKLRTLRDIIKEHDQEAFMVVMDASELLGRD